MKELFEENSTLFPGVVFAVIVPLSDEIVLKMMAYTRNVNAQATTATNFLNELHFLESVYTTYKKANVGMTCAKNPANKQKCKTFDEFVVQHLPPGTEMKGSLSKNLASWRKIKPEVIKELGRLYDEDDHDSAIQMTALVLDKTFTANKFALPKYLDATGPLQLAMLRHTLAVTAAKPTNRSQGKPSVLTTFKGNFTTWWGYLANVDRQRQCFKICYDELLVKYPKCSADWLPKWNSGLVQVYNENLNNDAYVVEVRKHKTNGGLIPALFTPITNWKTTLAVREKKVLEAEANAKKYKEQNELKEKALEEKLQLEMDLEAKQKAQELEINKATALREKEQAAFIACVAEAEANNKAEGSANVQVTEGSTRLAAKLRENKETGTFVKVLTAAEQQVLDAHKEPATRKRGRPKGATALKAELELFGSEPVVSLSSEEESDLGARLVFGCVDTVDGCQFLCEGNPIAGIAAPEINHWKPVLFSEDGKALAEMYKENFAPYDLIFSSLEGVKFTHTAIEPGGWVYWQIKVWSSLQVADGNLLLVISNSIMASTALAEVLLTHGYTLHDQPFELVTPARNGLCSDSVAWLLRAIKEAKGDDTMLIDDDLEVQENDRFGKQEIARKTGVYKSYATKPPFQLKTREENFRRPLKAKKKVDLRMYAREYNFAVVCELLDQFCDEGGSVYNGNGGLGGILPIATLRMGLRGYFIMNSEEELVAHKRRAAWAYKVFSGYLQTLSVLGEAAKRPKDIEKWDDITRGLSLREIHGKYLATESEPNQALLQVKAPAKKRLKVLAKNDAEIGTYLEELADYAGEFAEQGNFNIDVPPSMQTASYDPNYKYDGFKPEDGNFLEKINAAYDNTSFTIEEQPKRSGGNFGSESDSGYKVSTTGPLEAGVPIQAIIGGVYCLPEKEVGVAEVEEAEVEEAEVITWKRSWELCPIIWEDQNQVGEASAGLQNAVKNLRIAVRMDCLILYIRHASGNLPANCEWVYYPLEKEQFEERKNDPEDGFVYVPTYDRVLQGRSFIRAKQAIAVPENGKVELVFDVESTTNLLFPRPLCSIGSAYYPPDEVHLFEEEHLWTKRKAGKKATKYYSSSEDDDDEDEADGAAQESDDDEKKNDDDDEEKDDDEEEEGGAVQDGENETAGVEEKENAA